MVQLTQGGLKVKIQITKKKIIFQVVFRWHVGHTLALTLNGNAIDC